jgi:hypothetical protein
MLIARLRAAPRQHDGDHGQMRRTTMNAKQRLAASGAEQPDDLVAREWLSNFVARRPDKTEDHAQRSGIRGSVA